MDCRIKLIFFLIGICFLAGAQFANDWINPNQEYFKIKIGKDDFYRVTSEELQQAGFPVSEVLPSRIQLFRRGKEVSIRVVLANGQLNYIEFYGERNDGTGDTELYRGTQPHTHYSLFTDSASYFLTYLRSGSTDKRIQFNSDNNSTGLTIEPFHLEESWIFLNSAYYLGQKVGFNNSFSLGSYESGEAWGGTILSKGATQNFEFTINDRVQDVDGQLEIGLLGNNGNSHLVNISVGTNISSLTSVKQLSFEHWNSINATVSIPSSSIENNGKVVVVVTATGVGNMTESIGISYVKFSYPQEVFVVAGTNKILSVADGTNRNYLNIETNDPRNLNVYDISTSSAPLFLSESVGSDYVRVIVPAGSHQVIAVSNPSSVNGIEKVEMPNYEMENINYLILTHPKLSVGASQYAAYRVSPKGGSHSVLTATIDDIYNTFNYGDPSPIAIKKLLKYAESKTSIKNIFIIGKGYDTSLGFYRLTPSVRTRLVVENPDLINLPTFGTPGGDLYFTVGFGEDALSPAIPIGRINATTNQQVQAYLDKVMEMEKGSIDQLFRKNIIQLSGGVNEFEIKLFREYTADFTRVVESDAFGGVAINAGKETSANVEFINIVDLVNKGVGYITFFGHASGNTTDIEIGRVSNSEFGYANEGKYPIILVNGCKAGEIFGSSLTFGEDWIVTPKLGAVAIVAHADNATTDQLKKWSDLYYKLGFTTESLRGISLGQLINQISKEYLNTYGRQDSELSQVQLIQLQGDPAYQFYGATSPDFDVNTTDIFAESIHGTSTVLSTQDSFLIKIPVRNFGIPTKEKLMVEVERKTVSGDSENYVKTFKSPARLDTLKFYIKNDPTKELSGVNQFKIKLDPHNSIVEVNKENNNASFDLSIFGGSILNLFPINYGIVGNSNINLIWQSSDLTISNAAFDMEIDLNTDFADNSKQAFEVTGNPIASIQVSLDKFNLKDTTTFYWRTRLQNSNDNNDWSNYSFTYISKSETGWGQFTDTQFRENSLSKLDIDIENDVWNFTTLETPLELVVFGGEAPSYKYSDNKAVVNGQNLLVTVASRDLRCRENSLNVIVIDQISGDSYRPLQFPNTADVFVDEICGRIPQRIYSYGIQHLNEGRLQVLVDAAKTGDHFILFNIENLRYSAFSSDVINTLSELGITASNITNLQDGEPLIIIGKKGDGAGKAIVITTTKEPEGQQSLTYNNSVKNLVSSGAILSRTIGPAISWKSFSYHVEGGETDTYSIDFLGIENNGNRNIVATSTRMESFDFEDRDEFEELNENFYSRLRLDLGFSDEQNLSPIQLKNWIVNYELPPEGVLLPVSLTKKEINEGELFTSDFYFKNVGNVNFQHSGQVFIFIKNTNTGETLQNVLKIDLPAVGDSILFSVSFPSVGFVGTNNLTVKVSTNERELYVENNSVTFLRYFEVLEDQLNPVLDVTFDGRHISNGEISSPNPIITARLKDNNSFLFNEDTTGVNFYMKMPKSEAFQRINFSNELMQYIEATSTTDFEFTYRPQNLPDGTYEIRISASDKTGNKVGFEPYQITFQVINEVAISYSYPFPNPAKTDLQFYFTFTGSTLPDDWNIEIINMSGKVVRILDEDELGSIKVGINITNSWNGKDSLGNYLPNGIYLYKMNAYIDNQTISIRPSDIDKNIQSGYGKLYILH